MCCWSSQRLFHTCFQPTRASQLLEHISKLEDIALIWKKTQASRNCRQQCSFARFPFPLLSLLRPSAFLTASSSGSGRAQGPSGLAWHQSSQHGEASWMGLASAPWPSWSHLGGPRGIRKHLGWLCFWVTLWNPVYLSLNITAFVASFSFFSFAQGRLQGFYIIKLMSVWCQQDTGGYSCD